MASFAGGLEYSVSQITVAGFGSLISEDSARETVPGLTEFKLGTVDGYKRIFNKVGIAFIRRGDVFADEISVASCATRRDDRYAIKVCSFKCSEEEFAKIYDREHRYRWAEVNVRLDDGNLLAARMCTEFNDHDYRANKCVYPSVYHERVAQYYSGQIWRDDILPNKRYLAFCLKTLSGLSAEILDNFLDASFLADGETSIRAFLDTNPNYLDSAEAVYKQI